MARDMQKKAIANKKYDDKAYQRVAFRVKVDSPVDIALSKAERSFNIGRTTYIRNSLVSKLKSDGFLLEEQHGN